MNKVGSPRSFNYSKVKKDPGGWVDAKEFMPADYDLCALKIKGKKTITGWAIGLGWDGLHLRNNDEILFWKKQN